MISILRFGRAAMSLAGAAFLVLILPAFPEAQSTVHVVDGAGGPGSGFLTIGAAVAAASDGDVILVRDGYYPEVLSLDGLGVVVQADPSVPGAEVRVDAVAVQNLTVAQSAAVRGFLVGPPVIPLITGEALRVLNNQGAVWLEDLVFGERASEGVLVEDSCSVVLSNVTIGLMVFYFDTDTRMEVVRSAVHLFDSQIDASGFSPFSFTEPFGHPGIVVQEGSLGIYESTIVGGRGSTVPGGAHSCDDDPGPGGPAVFADDASTVVLQEADLVGGPGGGGGACPVGDQGPPIVANPSLVTQLASSARTHRVASPVRDDESLQVTVDGEPGDLVRVYLSITPGVGLTHPLLDVPLLLHRPWIRLSLGTLPASGTLSMSVPLGDLGPGVQAVPLYIQAVFFDVNLGRFVSSEPTSIVALDSAF